MAKKNVLRYILLGLLNNQPMTGYDLNQMFKDEIGEFWQAKHSQIYPELAKMEADSLISHKVEISGTKLEKKLYSITEEGLSMLKSWVLSPSEDLPVNRDEFVLKLFFINDINDPELVEIFKEQLKLHTKKLLHLEQRKEEIFVSEEQINAHYGHYLILDHGIKREQEYVAWLEGILSEIVL